MNAINITLVRSFLSLLFIGCLTTLSFGQIGHGDPSNVCFRNSVISICEGPGFPSTDTTNCGIGTIRVRLNLSCNSGYVPITIYCANIPGPQNNQGYYNWPSEMEPLHIAWEYEENVYHYTEEILNWNHFDADPQNPNLFYTTVYVVPERLENITCLGGVSAVENTYMHVKLVTPLSDLLGYDYYPINEYAHPDGIFSCETFDETVDCCNPDKDCIFEEPEAQVTVCLNCNDCRLQPPKSNNASSRLALDEDLLAGNLLVQPNPFSDNFEYSYFSKSATSQGKSTLYNANGTVIWSNDITIKKGLNKYTSLETNYPSGIYFLKIQSSTTNKVTQIIKLN